MPKYKVHELIRRVMPDFEIELSETERDVFMRRLQESAKRPDHARMFKQFIEHRRKDAEFDARPTRRKLRLAPIVAKHEAEQGDQLCKEDFVGLEEAINGLAAAINRLDALTSILVEILSASKGVLNVLQDGRER
jgi:hypothetical protein